MKHSTLLFALTIGLAVASLQTAAAQTDRSNDANIAAARKAIDAGNAEWIAGWKAADAEKMASLFDKDGSQFGAKGEVIRGRDAIHYRFSEGFKANGPALDFTITTLEVWLVDDLAYESGNFTGKVQPKGEDVINFSGKYVTIWKRQRDGSWKIWVDFGVPE
ncbi:MAG TPA: nuclear transport factor 2 family protein [Pyrinomonadaceae bacterium]|nr:nuclear transport factor 2 family protein [Pyrinomonadaceae bacterium]